MKLLTRTSLSYSLISLVVFVVSSLMFFHLLNGIFKRQIDENLYEEKLLIEQTINFSDSVPDFRLIFGHMIDVTILNAPQKRTGYIRDTLMYDNDLGTFASFRHLFAENTSFRKKGYTINIYKPLMDSEKLITEIVVSLALVFITLLLLLVLVNYFITRRIWIPFYRTLHILSKYEINQSAPIALAETDIHEFKLLNQVLEKMSMKIRLDYSNLKEFNENAAHELQTPLAIIKSKLELLIQKENLDENQLHLVSAIFEATTRMSKLNQGLLLISKIENNQFHQNEKVNLPLLIDSTLEHFSEMIGHRKITVSKEYQYPVMLDMNPSLGEILITNLVSNAIRHNVTNGRINIRVQEGSLTIANTGQIMKTNPHELFQRFRKSENNPGSVGLGLSIVQKIANACHMKVEYLHVDGWHTLIISFS
jgi:signal transduction histidine kinase